MMLWRNSDLHAQLLRRRAWNRFMRAHSECTSSFGDRSARAGDCGMTSASIIGAFARQPKAHLTISGFSNAYISSIYGVYDLDNS